MTIAETPPMGWNSFDAYATNVFEWEVRKTAEYMAEHLLEYGWEYVCIDARWYDPVAAKTFLFEIAPFEVDGFGRAVPATNRFPSSVDGCGLKPVSDYLHALGLKFGIHIMRGIPRQSAHLNTPILGTTDNDDWRNEDRVEGTMGARQAYLGAAGIANGKEYTCDFCQDNYGVIADAPGAYEWYRSLVEQYAAWGVDFLKVDNISKNPYSDGEIELIRRAIDEVERPIVLSLSPGSAPIEKADHVKRYANMWRISSDFWDTWEQLYKNFEQTALWAPHAGPGHWPDADMLPLGKLCVHSRRQPPRWTRFTSDEQRTLITLWSIARSPLLLGGQLWDTDEETYDLITNREIIAMNQTATSSRQLRREGDLVAWVATAPDNALYLAHFNLGNDTATVRTELSELPDERRQGTNRTAADRTSPEAGPPRGNGVAAGARRAAETPTSIRDLWSHSESIATRGGVESKLAPHACSAYRIV